MKIVPAILENTKESFSQSLTAVIPFSESVQIDFDDGTFGGNKTVDLSEIEDLIKPHSEKIYFEAHLMVQKPLDYIVGLEKAGFRKVIIQAEKEGEIRSIIEEFAYQGFAVGVALAVDSDVDLVEPYLEMIDSLTLMTVDLGKQGGEFQLDALKKIIHLRNLGYMGEIEVDGGVDDRNIKLLVEREVDVAVVGHFIVKSSDPKGSYEKLVSNI